jgi:D-3-phosphoglycerate dehydrogenase
MFRILVTDGLDKGAAESLRNMGHQLDEQFFQPEELSEKIKQYDVLIVRSATKVTRRIIDAARETQQLRLIIRAGVGVDNIDVDYAKESGIAVANTPNASSAAVAELVIAHIFTLARHLNKSNLTMKNGEWNKKEYKGIELSGKTLGLVGFGRIARETAKRAQALGMRVCYTNRSGEKADAGDAEYMSLPDLLRSSDFVSLHIPYDQDVGAVISQAEIALMKDDAYLINCARGGVVDEDALLQALDSGKLAGAGIDVFKEEPTRNLRLLNHKNVSLSPHTGGETREAQARIGTEIIEIIRKIS